MTSVVFTETPDSLVLCCRGHAGYAEYGKDIVCAGVSSLCTALAEGLQLLDSRGILPEHFCEYGDGYFRAQVSRTQKDEKEPIAAVFATVYAGLCAVQREYPKHVSCRKEKRRKGVKE